MTFYLGRYNMLYYCVEIPCTTIALVEVLCTLILIDNNHHGPVYIPLYDVLSAASS